LIIDQDPTSPGVFGLLGIGFRDFPGSAKVRAADIAIGKFYKRFYGVKQAIGVARFDRDTEGPVFEDQLLRLAPRLERVETRFLRP
jgi:hypothetical protein